MKEFEEYLCTIEPFDEKTALQFVYDHRNVFSDKVKREAIYSDEGLIIVKEISTCEHKKEVWYWCFTPVSRYIYRPKTDDDEIIKEIKDNIKETRDKINNDLSNCLGYIKTDKPPQLN